MSKKMTAVEWLEEQLIKEGIYVGEGFYEQAKAMEKEQIEKAYSNGRVDEQFKGTNSRFYRTKAEQYYKETYKQDEL